MTTITVMTTTVASADDAQRLAMGAVQARLAACVQRETIVSHYIWQGRPHEDAEWRLVCKTLPHLATALRDWLQAQHPYEVPQLLQQSCEAGQDYVRWMEQQLQTGSSHS